MGSLLQISWKKLGSTLNLETQRIKEELEALKSKVSVSFDRSDYGFTIP